MSTNGPFVLVPIPITDAMITSSTVAEPASSETAWVSGGTYALGDRRIRATTHRVYECALAHTGVATLPENDTVRWFDYGPTLKFAAFDTLTSTKTTATTTYTVVLTPGFFNSVAIYGADGANFSAVVKDAPSGTTIFSYAAELREPAIGMYEWLFGRYKPITKIVLRNIPISPTAELTITVSAAAGVTVGIGMISIGDMRALLDESDWGGTEYGATAEPVDFSYIKTDDLGVTTIKKRHYGTDMRVKVKMPPEAADYFLATIQEVLATPACWIAVDATGYAGLNVFGLGSGPISYDSAGDASWNGYVKGLL